MDLKISITVFLNSLKSQKANLVIYLLININLTNLLRKNNYQLFLENNNKIHLNKCEILLVSLNKFNNKIIFCKK